MQLIRCTKKPQKEMGLKLSDLCTEEPRFSYLGPWHANLIHIDRRKCVQFVNDKTLFNFIVPDLSRAQIRELDKLFKSYLSSVIADAGISETERARILSEYDEVGFANTNSKSVLGSMNDLAFHYKYSIQEAGGVHSPAVPEIIRQLNRMPIPVRPRPQPEQGMPQEYPLINVYIDIIRYSVYIRIIRLIV